jgi:hypothetical protein
MQQSNDRQEAAQKSQLLLCSRLPSFVIGIMKPKAIASYAPACSAALADVGENPPAPISTCLDARRYLQNSINTPNTSLL